MSTVELQHPTKQEIEDADVETLLTWNRFLPRAMTVEHHVNIDAILARLDTFRVAEPWKYTEASRRVGFDF